MNKRELIEKIRDRTEWSLIDVTHTVDALLEIITAQLQAGQEVSLLGFGSFKVSHRAARQGRNPSTGESVAIAASRGVQFKVGKKLKEAVRE
jgi:DNA-binding protein HU-beta